MSQFLNPSLRSTCFLIANLFLWSGVVSGQPVHLANIDGQYPLTGFEMIEFEENVFFRSRYVDSNSIKAALWRTDGTPGNTILIDSLKNQSHGVARISDLTTTNQGLFITTNNMDLWFIDDVSSEAQLIMTRDASHSIYNLTSASDSIFFLVEPNEIWVSDGSIDGTYLLTHAMLCSHPSFAEMIAVGRNLYFEGFDEQHGCELWKTDGTQHATTVIKDINPGTGSSGPHWLSGASDLIYFASTSQEFGKEVWFSDGSDSGTQMIRDFNVGPGGSNPRELVVIDNQLYFQVSNMLWISDGTQDGTRLVEPEDSELPYKHPYNIVKAGESVYFYASNGVVWGRELRRIDKVSGKAILIQELPPEVSPYNVTGKLFECGADLCYTTRTGPDGGGLYRTNGDVNNAKLIVDFKDYFESSLSPGGPSYNIIPINEGIGAVFGAWSFGFTSKDLWYISLEVPEDEETEDEIITSIDHNLPFRLYPNPSQDHLNIELSYVPEEISILDVQGKYHYQGTGFSNSSVSIPTAGLKAGMYILIVDHQAFKFMKR